jgi:hypothetical protein
MSVQGISITDFKSHGWNSCIEAAHILVGYISAYIIRDLAKKILKEQTDYRKHLATGIATTGGIAISTLLLSPLHLVSCPADKYPKFFAIQALLAFAATWISQQSKCLPLTFIGCSGYFGNSSLSFFGAAGAILGAARPFHSSTRPSVKKP